jgi:hypothetical protein
MKGKFCKECGEETITKCRECNTSIEGRIIHARVSAVGNFIPPKFCYGCGNPHPWTRSKIDALEELIEFEEKLSESNKEELKKNINDIITETPRTKIATMKFKHLITKMGKETGIVAKNLAIEIASETAKKILLGETP